MCWSKILGRFLHEKIFISFVVQKDYFVKLSPNFVCSPSFHFKIYQRILRNTSLFSKSLSDFISPNLKTLQPVLPYLIIINWLIDWLLPVTLRPPDIEDSSVKEPLLWSWSGESSQYLLFGPGALGRLFLSNMLSRLALPFDWSNSQSELFDEKT